MKNAWYILLVISCLSLGSCVHEVKKKNKKTQSFNEMAAFSPFLEEKPCLVNAVQSADEFISANHPRPRSGKRNSYELMREHEAKLADIPVPLHVSPLSDFCSAESSAQGVMLGYSSTLSVDDTRIFYQEEMERMGWQQSAMCQGTEQLVCFEKPTRFCTISIRPGIKGLWSSSDTTIVVCAGDKC